MFKRNIILYLVFAAVLFTFPGCSDKKSADIPAFIVIDIIPERVNKNIFEKAILNHKTVKSNRKKELDILQTAYKLDANNEYVLIPKEKSDNEKKLTEIFRTTNYAPLFTDVKAEKLIKTINEWEEITCLMPKDEPRAVKTKDPEGNEKTREWYKIKAGADEGWILSDYLLFKSFKETEAVVIKKFRLLSVPDIFKRNVVIRECNRGLSVTLTGYEYNERGYGTQLTYMKVYDEYGWGVEGCILVDAHIGVILPDEVTMYNAPEDIKANAVEKPVYTKMEIVPYLDILENDWYKVIYEDKNNAFYIKEGNVKISSKKDDITFASWVREDYVQGKMIVDEVMAAKNADPIQGVGKISGKREKMNKLEEISEYIEEKKNEYPDSVFAGIGPYSLREFLVNVGIAKGDLERVISSTKEEPPADTSGDEEPVTEEGEGEEPEDGDMGGA